MPYRSRCTDLMFRIHQKGGVIRRRQIFGEQIRSPEAWGKEEDLFTNQFGDGIRRNTFVSQTWGQTVHRQYHRWTRKKLYGEKFREKEIDLIFSIWCIFFVFWEVLERIGYLCKWESIVFKNAVTCVNLKGKKDNFNIEFTNVLNIAFTNVRRLLRK